jgi:hypothetical protein
MSPALLRVLYEREPEIRGRWQLLLRGEPIRTALAHPVTLEFMITDTIQAVLGSLAAPDGDQRRPTQSIAENGNTTWDRRRRRGVCACGRNPLLAYFQAGEQALLETLVLAQAERPGVRADERRRSVVELRAAIHALADAEVAAFCGVCRYRWQADGENAAGSARSNDGRSQPISVAPGSRDSRVSAS